MDLTISVFCVNFNVGMQIIVQTNQLGSTRLLYTMNMAIVANVVSGISSKSQMGWLNE